MLHIMCLTRADAYYRQGKVSAPRSLVAGLGAGMMEAIFAVTPSETIKYANRALTESVF